MKYNQEIQFEMEQGAFFVSENEIPDEQAEQEILHEWKGEDA